MTRLSISWAWIVWAALAMGMAEPHDVIAAEPGAQERADAEIALQRALDQPLTLSLDKVELSEAFKQIAVAAKIPLQVDPACYEFLPYGATTRVSVDFKQSKLREALDEVLIPLGLQETVAGGGASTVMIQPSNPLLHIGRRADWEELKLLKELWSSPELKKPAPGPLNLTEAIRAALDGRKDLIVSIAGEDGNAAASAAAGNGTPEGASNRAIAQISAQLPMSAYRALELYCQLADAVWFVEAGALAGGPTGGTIRIMPKKQWIQRQLERPIQLSRTNEPLELVVADLTHASGIHFVPEPGLYQAVPVVSLRSDNGTVQQTLEALAGATRIAFDVREDSILLHMAPGSEGNGAGSGAGVAGNQGAGAGTVARGDTIVGRMSVPVGPGGALMDVYIREIDLPPELNELRKKQVQEAVEGLQKTWATNGVMAATQPAANTATTQKNRE